jgi:hypothetical protein
MTDNTDKELLELAAKAAGIKASSYPDGIWRNFTGFNPAMNLFGAPVWNPIEDDGDALRLAVKLSLMLDEITQGYMAGHWVATHTNIESCYEPSLPDPLAATRRAIVRAAAEIGRNLK